MTSSGATANGEEFEASEEEMKIPSTARLISFVSEVCSDLDLEMIGEGIETEEDKQLMLDLGCKIGQGYLMHRPDFLDSFKAKDT